MGTSYAMWYKVLTINGTVNTGYVDAIFTNVMTRDTEIPEKDVSNITATLSSDAETMNITLNNAYPCINYILEFDIMNTGSIPVIIDNTTMSNYPCCMDLGGNLTNVIGIQLEPNESVHVIMIFHLTNNCDQNVTYTFTVTITAVQWNEAVHGGS